MQYKNSSIRCLHGEPTSRAHTAFSFSLIKQQKQTKQTKMILIPQTLVPKGGTCRLHSTCNLPEPTTAARVTTVYQAVSPSPAPSPLPCPEGRLSDSTTLWVTTSPPLERGGAESREGEKAFYERISLLILFIQIKK